MRALPHQVRAPQPTPPAPTPAPKPPAPPGAMNVLFFVIDDLRPEFNKAYGASSLLQEMRTPR